MPIEPRLRFQATISGKFASTISLRDDDIDINSMITTYNTAVTATVSEILENERLRKKNPGSPESCSTFLTSGGI